jgi:predicted PurR-regulated permease PerM
MEREKKTPQRSARLLHPETPPWLLRAVIFAAVIWWGAQAAVDAAISLRVILITLVSCFIAACALEVPVNFLEHHRWPRSLATLSVLGVLVAGFLFFAGAVATLVSKQASTMIKRAPHLVASATKTLNHWFHLHINATKLSAEVHNFKLSHLLSTHGATLEASGASTLAAIGLVLMGLFVAYYLVSDGPHLRRVACSFLPPRSQKEFVRAWDLAVEKTGGYFVSRFILMVIRFVALLPLLEILHVPYAVVLSLWFAIISEFIPVIGSIAGCALPILLALSISPRVAVVVAIYVVVLTLIRDYVLAPKLTRATMSLHPALAFLSVIVAAKLIGPLGALIAIPLLATLQAFFSSYIERHDLHDDVVPPLTPT